MIDNNTQMMEDRELDWDDEIEHDSPDFILLPEGDYDFEVVEMERGRYQGGDKIPPCKKATVHLKIETPDGINIIRHPLFMHTATEGLLCAFFMGIGQRKKGEKLRMNWPSVVGSRGRAKVGIRKWTDDKGQEHEMNQIKRFYEPEDQAPFEAKQTTFTPGAF